MQLFGRRKTSSLMRTFLTVAALLIFASQSFITQTHIHHFLTSAAPLTNSKAPIDKDDAAHCPFSQAMAQAGHVLTPTPVLVPQPCETSIVSTAQIFAEPSFSISPHDWHGRAPPQA